MKNRILAYLLCVLMLVGMVPVSVSAADPVVAQLNGGGDYTTIQAAVNAAIAAGPGNNVIELVEGTIKESFEVSQEVGVNITIQGAHNRTTLDGNITIKGNSPDGSRSETLKIQYIDFNATTVPSNTAYISVPGKTNTNYRYAHNVTIDNCTFTYSGTEDVAAIRSTTGGDYNWTIKNCSVDATMHSLLQAKNIENGLVIEGCTINSEEGINLNNTVKAEILGNTFNVSGYAIRTGEGGTANSDPDTIVITDNKITTTGTDSPIIVRGTAGEATLELSKNTVVTPEGVPAIDVSNATSVGRSPVIEESTVAGEENTWNGKSTPVVTGYAASIGGDYYVTIDAALAAATAGDEIKVLENVSWPNGLNVKNKEITIVGASKSIVIDYTPYDSVGGDDGGRYGNDSKLTFKNITLKHTNRNYRGWKHSISETYEDCIIEGQIWTYGVASFKNCTFNQTSADAYNIWTYGALTATFTDCTFNSAGKAALVYKEHGSTVYTASFKNCTFNASAPVTGKAAIEIDSSLNPYKVTVENCTANGFDKGSVSGNTLWNVKNGADKVEVVANTITWDVDGTKTTVDGTYPEVIVKPADPTKYGFIFAGWEGYTEGMTMPANDVVFTAKWTRDASVPVVLGIEAAVTELVGGGEIALTVTTDAPDLLGAVVVTCDDPDVVITGSGANWTATVPDATKSYTFTVAFNDTVTGFGEPTDTCVVAVSKTPSSKQEPAFDYVLFALAARYAQRYDVLVSADNATVTGDMTIKYKRAGTVEIAVAEGYQLVDVIANGQSLGAVTSVTFKKVMAPQTLVVVTEPIPTEEPVVEAPAA